MADNINDTETSTPTIDDSMGRDENEGIDGDFTVSDDEITNDDPDIDSGFSVDADPMKPILFIDYKKSITYYLKVTYEDNTDKTVELKTGDSSRPYKFTYKRNGKLCDVIGIPRVKEIRKESNFTDFANRSLDSKDLLIEVDTSKKFNSKKVRFYLKDIREVIDLVKEGYYDPEENKTLILNGGSSYDDL